MRLSNKTLFVCFSLVAAFAFLIIRVPYYTTVFVPGISPDTFTYFFPAYSLSNGMLPLFDLRTPGYPLFLYTAQAFTTTLKGVHVFQSIFSLVVIVLCLFLTTRLKRFRWSLSIALLLVYCNTTFLAWEVMLNPTGPFTVLTMLYGLLLVTAFERRPAFFVMNATVVLCFLILLRPQGIFLLPLHAVIVAFFSIKGRLQLRCLAYICLMVIAPVVFTPVYNLWSTGNSSSRFTTVSKYCMVATLIQPDTTLPAPINRAVLNCKAYFSPHEKYLVTHSWDMDTLAKLITVPNYDKGWELSRAIAAEYNIPFDSLLQLPVEAKQLPMQELKTPGFYPRFIVTNIYSTCKLLYTYVKFSFFINLQNSCLYLLKPAEFETKDPDILKSLFREYYTDVVVNKRVNLGVFKQRGNVLVWEYSSVPKLLKPLYFYEYYVDRLLWSLPFFLLAVAGFLWLWFKRSYIGFVFSGIVLLNLLLVALLIPPLPRYIIIFYYFFAAIPLVFFESIILRLKGEY